MNNLDVVRLMHTIKCSLLYLVFCFLFTCSTTLRIKITSGLSSR